MVANEDVGDDIYSKYEKEPKQRHRMNGMRTGS